MNLTAAPTESPEVFVKKEPISEENLDSTPLNFLGPVKSEECFSEYDILGDASANEGADAGCEVKLESVKVEVENNATNDTLRVTGLNDESVEGTNSTCQVKIGGGYEDPVSFSASQVEEEHGAEMAEDIFTFRKVKKEEEGDGKESVAEVPPLLWYKGYEEIPRGSKRTAEAPHPSCRVQKKQRTMNPQSAAKRGRSSQLNQSSEPSGLRVRCLQDMQQKDSSRLEFCYVCVDYIAGGYSFKEHFDESHQNSCFCFVCGSPSSSFTAFLNHLNQHSLSCDNCNESFASQKLALLHRKALHSFGFNSLVPVKSEREDFVSSNDESVLEAPLYKKTNRSVDLSTNFCRTPTLSEQRYTKSVSHAVTGVKDEIVGALSNLRLPSRAPKLNHICDLCQKGFRTRQHLRRHEFTHREKPEICKQCCLSFNTLEELKEHRISVHAGDLPYVCKVCGLAYEKSVSFRDHMKKIHFGGKKVYQCELCNKVLSNKLIYQTHLRTHSGEKPFKCTVCGKSYHDKYSMLKHERLHKMQPVYKCPLCDKSYNRSCLMSEHIKWNHAITAEVEMSNYQCGVCQEELGNADCFMQHVYNHSCQEISYNAVESTAMVAVE